MKPTRSGWSSVASARRQTCLRSSSSTCLAALDTSSTCQRPPSRSALVGVAGSAIAIVVVAVLLLGGLTARPQIQNTSAGLVLTMRPSFGVGDQIEVMDTRGPACEIGSHSTVLESVDGVKSYIPNTSMLGEMVHVYTAADARRAQFDMSLAAGTDIAKALGIILQVAHDRGWCSRRPGV